MNHTKLPTFRAISVIYCRADSFEEVEKQSLLVDLNLFINKILNMLVLHLLNGDDLQIY